MCWMLRVELEALPVGAVSGFLRRQLRAAVLLQVRWHLEGELESPKLLRSTSRRGYE